MFQIRWRSRTQPLGPPDAFDWWERMLGDEDPKELLVELTRQLEFAIGQAKRGARPTFLGALGRDLESELQKLRDRIAFRTTESGVELTRRRELLEEMVEYYCDAVAPSSKPPSAVELSDCAREAVAGLSADMTLILRVRGEPSVVAGRRALISLIEVTIRAASAGANDEVEVTLPPCSGERAELRVEWNGGSPMPPEENRDKTRFLALAVAYSLKIGGALRRATGPREAIVLEIPLHESAAGSLATPPSFDSEVVSQAAELCLEG